MKILDTDTLTFFLGGRQQIVERFRQETDEVATTVMNRIEILQGRFATLLTAADGAELRRAQQLLDETLAGLERIPKVISIDDATANEFDRLRQNKKLKKIGRADLLIAAIVLANRATLVTRNVKDFRQVPGLRIENWAE
jgi:tRNA(fMet)-specific endonuclease VapC